MEHSSNKLQYGERDDSLDKSHEKNTCNAESFARINVELMHQQGYLHWREFYAGRSKIHTRASELRRKEMRKITTTIIALVLSAGSLAAFGPEHPETAVHQPCPCDRSTKKAGEFGESMSGEVLHEPSAMMNGGPAFVYETIIPGYWLSRGLDMTVDADGNSYVIASWYQDHQHLDILVIKLDADGTPLWTLPIVGDPLEHDYPTDITLDNSNNVWVTGWTSSESFPIVDGFDDTLTGFVEVFIMKLDPADGSILYSTFLGGDYADRGEGITIGESGEVYVVGTTGSTDFPTTPDAYQSEPSAPLYIYTDAFITKLSPDGRTILYSTYFGGFKDDWAQNVALDPDNNIVFSGKTNADDFPLENPLMSDPNSIFISKLSADGSTLMFSTYFGGEDLDGLGGMAIDSENYVYITGSTRSIDFPTTPGAFQEDFVGEVLGCETVFPPTYYNCEDVFVTKLGTEGDGLVYSTFLAGSDIDHGRDIAVDDQGRAHVVGYTYSPDFPPDGGPGSGADIFLSRLDPGGSGLDFTILVDSSTPGAGHGAAVDNEGGVYLTAAKNAPADIYIAKIAAYPDITVSIWSDMTEVPRKSDFIFSASVTNNEPTGQTMQVWSGALKLPYGPLNEPLMGPAGITLNPGETRTLSDIAQYVGNVPLGAYRYFARAGGDFPEPSWDEDYLDIEVIP